MKNDSSQPPKHLHIICSSCLHCAGWSSSRNTDIPGRSEVKFIMCACPEISQAILLYPALECPYYKPDIYNVPAQLEGRNGTNKIIFEVTLENCPFPSDVECGITLEDDDYWDRRKCDFEKCPLRKMSLWDIVEMCRSDDY